MNYLLNFTVIFVPVNLDLTTFSVPDFYLEVNSRILSFLTVHVDFRARVDPTSFTFCHPRQRHIVHCSEIQGNLLFSIIYISLELIIHVLFPQKLHCGLVLSTVRDQKTSNVCLIDFGNNFSLTCPSFPNSNPSDLHFQVVSKLCPTTCCILGT